MCSHGQHPKGRYLGDGEELEDRTNDALNVCYIESPNRLSNSKFNDVDFYVETFTYFDELEILPVTNQGPALPVKI